MTDRDGEIHDVETREGGAMAAPAGDYLVVTFPGGRRIVEMRAGADVIVGRSRTATISVADERVSREHLRLFLRDGRPIAEDLGSKNRTLLNGVPLDGQSALSNGDQLCAGPVLVEVRFKGARGSHSGVRGEADLDEALLSEVERGLRYRRQFALLHLRLSGDGTARSEAAARAASRLRRMDLIADYAPGEYVAVLPELDRPAAERLLVRLLSDGLDVARVKVDAAIVVFPEDGASAAALLEKVRARIRSAAQSPAAAVVVADPRMVEVFETARRAARRELTVLVTGETGTGKEVVATEIHRASPRSAEPFVHLNCAALPESLLETELFGSERGAFTGAERRRIGFIEAASGGTLFIDELGEMTPALQAKMLHVLESRRLTRVGGTDEIEVNVRFVVATHRDLERMVAEGRFREDLYYRVSALVLRLPPLRERPAEILAFAEHFAAEAGARARFSAEAVEALRRYRWPGNVRELRNVVERALVFADGALIPAAALPGRVLHATSSPGSSQSGNSIRDDLEAHERREIEQALVDTAGNRSEAARRLGISRRSLQHKLKKYDIH